MYDVSIIIPHYNTPDTLEKLIESIPDNDSIQIIVVDDNSTKCVKELNELQAKYEGRIEFYKNTSGIQSAGACRNTGLMHASGEWLLFADADDYFVPEFYSIISRYIESDYDQIIFNVTSIFADTGEAATRHLLYDKRIKEYLRNPDRRSYLRVLKRYAPWGKMIRRSVVEINNIRFSQTLHGNDLFFSIQASFFCKRNFVVDEIIYCVTRSGGSLTTVVSAKAYECYVSESIKCYLFSKERYSKKDLKYLNYNGLIILYDGIKRKVGAKCLIRAFILMVRKGLPIVTLMNPKQIIDAFVMNRKFYSNDTRYLNHKS